MITKLQKEYFQKSKAFLYPLLGIKNTVKFKPDNTYISWEDKIKFYDNVLICVYTLVNSQEYRNFEKSILFYNIHFIDFFYLTNNKVAYIFSLEIMIDDYHLLLDSKYSRMSDDSKQKILKYFNFPKESQKFHWINSYMYPERYYSLYSVLLKIDVWEIEETAELCPLLNTNKETLTVKPMKILL
jgi:hypothetical protein